MTIKPKNPTVAKIRRGIVALVALLVVVSVLLHRPEYTAVDEGSGPAEVPVMVAPEEESVGEGSLDWEYPPGWVDYSDLPAAEELGDEDQPGLTNWRYILVNGLDQANYLRDTYYPDMEEIEGGYYFQRRAAEDLRAFLAAARAEGYIVSMSRTYMSYADQRVRFNGMASTIYDRGGCTLAEAETQVKEQGYYPGADEHQTGLAVNFVGEGGEAKFSTPGAGMDAGALLGVRVYPPLSRGKGRDHRPGGGGGAFPLRGPAGGGIHHAQGHHPGGVPGGL